MSAEVNLSDLFAARYESGGRGPEAFDCFGLFSEVCRRRGITVPEHQTPEAMAARADLIAAGRAADWIEIDKPEPYCAVALRIGPFVAHMGVVLDDCRHFLHACEGTGISVELLTSPRWEKRIAGFYRHA